MVAWSANFSFEVVVLVGRLVASARNARPVEFCMYAVAGALLFLSGVVSPSVLGLKPTRVVKVPVVQRAQLGSYADVVKALGTPDSVVDGAQVNPQLQGARCAVYSAKRLIVCG